MFNRLLDHFGPQHWWPAETELEMLTGAILTQNTNWNNVVKAIDNLKNRNLLTIKALYSVQTEALALQIRPSGYYNIKAARLKNLISFIVEKYDGNLSEFLNETTSQLREGLLSVKGIGPETADSILLYAARRSVFVVDAYTYRILNRHEMFQEQTTYHELQQFFMNHLPEGHSLFNEFHALIVNAGKTYCKKKPRCSDCPLKGWNEA
jgi:endonuclease-3 related protein